ncbi:LysR substrate-binding domain-containing protein [Algihabitans albus]|uniref:LysR substrate-binding domain-containing protein n=1 Tax=Algihabitans albus TaxID=2164067 RepID=UPI000E5D9159|nr:LysR substrate-binding domain-containing protein [Algihabitans albus]
MVKPFPASLLTAFEAAGRTGSFRAAAAELNLTPSAVSHAIRKLEDQLGAKLFLRSARAVRLSPEGLALFEAVARGYQEIRAGLEIVATREAGLLRLHCAPSFAATWLMPRLGLLLRENEGLDIRLASSTSYVDFPSEEFDADIVYGPPKTKGTVVVPLIEETLTPLCAPELAPAIRRAEDLSRQRLIQSDNKLLRWNDWFRRNDLPMPPQQGPRFDRSFLAIAAAADGLGVALESTLLAERELASGALVRPLGVTARNLRYVGHYLVFPQIVEQKQPIQLFRRWLLDRLTRYGEPARC